MVTTPGPSIQKVNAALHREPLESIIHGVYWSTIFLVSLPLLIIFLSLQTLWRLFTWCIGRSNETPIYDPKNKPEYDMAVVITGCDTGFGKDMAIYAASAGYTVFAGCYKHEVSKKVFETFPKIFTFQLDVTKDIDTAKAYELVLEWKQEKSIPIEDVGRKRVLHALINNAGIGMFSETDWTDLSIFEAMMDVNFFGMIRMVKAFLPLMKDQAIQKTYSGMRIINTVSMAGFASGAPGLTGYSASKYAAQSFTDSLRSELYPFKIAVTSVNPSFHATPLIGSLDLEVFQKLPHDIQVQYGKPFYDSLISNLNFLFTVFQWNPIVVVEQVVDKCLRSHYPPRQLLIGMDAKFLLIGGCKMVPPIIREPIQNLIFHRPIPDCLKKK